MVSHRPHRSWCPFCVRGRARDLPHRKGGADKQANDVVSLDYMIMTDDDKQQQQVQPQLPVMVIKDHGTGLLFAVPLAAKGAGEDSVVAVVSALASMGRARMGSSHGPGASDQGVDRGGDGAAPSAWS